MTQNYQEVVNLFCIVVYTITDYSSRLLPYVGLYFEGEKSQHEAFQFLISFFLA